MNGERLEPVCGGYGDQGSPGARLGVSHDLCVIEPSPVYN